ncbi:MAG: insulinase family protein, partial [Chryseosolibacter sp.]
IYRNRFGNGQDFGFVLSGNFEVERIIPLIQKYLGSLPSKDIEVESLKRNYQVSRRNVKRTFHGRLDSNDATVQLIYRNVGDTRSDHLTMETMAHAMEIMLGQRLRRQNGGTYMVTVSYRKEQPGGHGFFVDFDCDPKDVEKMIDDVSKVINEMTSGGMPPAVVQNAIAIRKQVLDKEMMDSRFWPNYIKGQVREGRDLSEIVQQELHLEQITSGSLQRSSKRFFRQAQRMEFVLLP